MPLDNGKASILDEQTRLGKYTMIQGDGAPLLSVEDAIASKNFGCFVSTGMC